MSLTVLSALAWAKQENAYSLTYASGGYPKSFEATSNGAANGTTIISSTLGSYGSANDDFVGYLVECSYAANGPAGEYGSPLRRKIVAYEHSTTTLTVEAFPFQVSADDSFALIKQPNGSVVEDTGGSTTNVVDATRDEADDYWTGAAEKGGPYLVAINAGSIGAEQKIIYDFESSTGTFSTAAFSASTAVGDLFEVWEYPEPWSGVPMSFNQPRLDNTSIKGSRGMVRGTAGLREGSGTIELAFRGPGRSRIAEASELDTPLGVHCDVSKISNCTVSTGATTTTIPVSAGSPVANDLFVTESGDVVVASAGGSSVTATPPARVAPAENSTLYGMRQYAPSDTINYAMAIKQWIGKEMIDTFYGCVPAITFSAARGDYMKAALAFQCADGYRVHKDETNTEYSRSIRPKISSVVPRTTSDGRVVLYDGTTSVELACRSFNLDLGFDIQAHINLEAPNSTDGFECRNDNPSLTIDAWLDSETRAEIQNFLMGKKFSVLVQIGKYVGNPGIFAFWANECEYTGAELADDAGSMTVSLPLRVVVEPGETTMNRWMIGIA